MSETGDNSDNGAAKPVCRLRASAVCAMCIALPLAIGGIGSLGADPNEAGHWWWDLQKPIKIMPPNWFFGVLWTVIYILMGVSTFLLWFKNAQTGVDITFPILLYGVSLILNGFWTGLYFGKALFIVALVDSFLLLIVVVGCIILFWRIWPVAGALLIPYGVTCVIAITFQIVVIAYYPNGLPRPY